MCVFSFQISVVSPIGGSLPQNEQDSAGLAQLRWILPRLCLTAVSCPASLLFLTWPSLLCSLISLLERKQQGLETLVQSCSLLSCPAVSLDLNFFFTITNVAAEKPRESEINQRIVWGCVWKSDVPHISVWSQVGYKCGWAGSHPNRGFMTTPKCEFLRLITTSGELQCALVLVLTLVKQLEDCPYS